VNAERPAERPPGFTYKRATKLPGSGAAELCADAVSLASLARRFGTPAYVYSASTIRQRYEQFDASFAGAEHTICYSVKANSNLAILKLLADLGAGFDVVSGGELQRVAAIGKGARPKVVFSGVGKQAEEMDLAIGAGVLVFNIESASELELLTARAQQHRKVVPMAVRVNPDVAAETHPYISTGLHEHKFGVPLEDAFELYRKAARAKYLRPAGVSVHIGSQIRDVTTFGEAMEAVVAMVKDLRTQGHDIRYVDAGGGLGISYEPAAPGDFSAETKRYAKAVLEPLRGLGVHLLLEPGRSIIGPAGVLLTRVLYRKRNGSKQFLIVDAAMNDLLRPALYKAHHEIVPVLLAGKRETEKVDVVGPVCETGDFFARDRQLPKVQEGELIAILDAGAYGMSLSSNYNSRPRPAEVLVDGKRARLIRKRESMRDLLAPERA
jgi:diaminopimelate decarboxylase